jgi:ATPase subunit of ABC transporter with duplicated ATPase domains
MFTLHHISYSHTNGDLLFNQLDLSILQKEKAALVGNNGTGKSTLLKIIAGELLPTSGQIMLPVRSYLVPQIFGQFDHLTIAQALKVDGKLKGLQAILNGDGAEENFTLLEDDWTIQERCAHALSNWELQDIDLDLKLSTLSGGQKAKVFLAGITIHQPQLILMDEPSNHLDVSSRHMLYELIESSLATMLIVSHDRKLLNLLDQTYELNTNGIRAYGGNYDFYAGQKKLEQQALLEDLENRQKELRKAKEVERDSFEQQQKLDARGKRELIVLDEPTNNLDLQSLMVLTHTVRSYNGALIVVSHDERFITEVGCSRIIRL